MLKWGCTAPRIHSPGWKLEGSWGSRKSPLNIQLCCLVLKKKWLGCELGEQQDEDGGVTESGKERVSPYG